MDTGFTPSPTERDGSTRLNRDLNYNLIGQGGRQHLGQARILGIFLTHSQAKVVVSTNDCIAEDGFESLSSNPETCTFSLQSSLCKT